MLVGGVGGEAQRRIGAGPADQLVQRGHLAHRLDQALGGQLGDLAGVALGERVRALLRLVELLVDQGGWSAAPAPGAEEHIA